MTNPAVAMFRTEMQLKDASYPILVDAGARHSLPELLPPGAARAAIVTQANIGWEVDPGCDSQVFHIADGEQAKSLATIERLCREFADWGLTRADVVVGVGGGVVTDVAGFAAAVYHRGVEVIHVATSLLGQIDAAIGGKTGVNIPEGKNLVGAFWQPRAVLCDLETLATLPEKEHQCGYGELAKYCFLEEVVDLRSSSDTGTASLAELPLAELALPEQITRCVALKAAIVSQDEREQGQRALLNYGHTLAHALESAGNYGLSHGEAVAVGLVYAAEVAHLLGRISVERLAAHKQVVQQFGLPFRLDSEYSKIPSQDLLGFFKRDKKATQGLTMVLDGPNGPEVVTGLDPDVLLAALEQVR